MNENLVREITALEWEMFRRVENEGGPASCQSDPRTFVAMRGAQLLAWETPLLTSYHQDLLEAGRAGRNLLAEKYARMMASTHPAEYARLAGDLPPLDPEAPALIDAIAVRQIAWAGDLAARFPAVSGRGRPLLSRDDSPGATSTETYLRGELATFSPRTLALYDDYQRRLGAEGGNLCAAILENTAHAYGYASLEAAEQVLARE